MWHSILTRARKGLRDLMAIQVYCNCGNPLFVPPELGGRKIKCQSCGSTLKVPKPESDAPDPEEAEKLQQSGGYEVLDAQGKPSGRTSKQIAEGKPVSVQLSCPACGARVEMEDTTCTSCGASLGGGGATRPDGGRGLLGSVPRPVLFLILAVVGLGGVGLAIYRAWLASRPSTYTAEGIAALSDKDYPLAKERFLLALEYDPAFSEAILGMARVGEATKDSRILGMFAARGIELCKEKAVKAKLRLALARDLLEREKWRDAYNVANDASHEDDTIKGVSSIKGLAALKIYEDQPAKADEESFVHLKEAVAEGEQKEWQIYFHLARIMHKKKEEGAREHAEKAVEMHQGDAEAWLLVAVLREEAGEKGGARAALTKVVELQPENAPAHVRLSKMHWEAGNPDEALREAMLAKQQAPDMPEAALAVGRALVTLDRLKDAKVELEKAAKAGAGWEAEFLLGRTYYAQKDWKNGATWFQRGLDKRRDDAALHLQAGELALAAGDSQNAQAILTRCLNIDGKNYPARLRLAQSYGTTVDLRRRSDRAIVEALEVAKEQDATRPEAWIELVVQHLELGRIKEALQLSKAGLQACPNNVELMYQKARACVEAKLWTEAIATLDALKTMGQGSYKDFDRLERRALEGRIYEPEKTSERPGDE